MLLGREPELTELTAALGRAERGVGSAFFLSGEPGIGKTHLADALATRGAERGFQVAWGRVWDSGAAPAYFPWIQALAALGRELPSTASFVDQAQAARFELFREVADMLRALAERAPLLVLLDDLHAADVSSLLLLNFIARQTRASRMVLVGTFRDVEARQRPDVATPLAQAAREGRCLQLRRLNQSEATALMCAGEEPPAAKLQVAIFQATQGNPFFIEELLRLVAAEPKLALSGSVPIPFSVREVIRQRLGSISARVRSALELGAVFGAEFRAQAVAHALGISEPDLAADLVEPLALAVIVRVAPGKLAFSHALVREALYRDLPNSQRMELHARAGKALEELLPYAISAAELAHHYLEAGAGHVERAVAFAVRAADEALAVSACEEALHLLERARAAAIVTSRGVPLQVEILFAEARAFGRLGDRTRAQDSCRQAADVARKIEDRELFARAALGYGEEIMPGVVDPALVRLLEQALEALPEGPLHARVLARLAAAIQPAEDFAAAIRLAREAIKAARRTGDQRVLLEVIHAAVSAMMDITDPLERVALNREQIALAEQFADQPKRLYAHQRLAFDYLELGDLARVDAEIEAYDRLASDMQRPQFRWRAAALRALRAGIAGRFAEADELIEKARKLASDSRDPDAGAAIAGLREGRLRTQTRFEELGVAARESTVAFRRVPNGEWYGAMKCAFAAARSGRREEAQRLLEGISRTWLAGHSDQAVLPWTAEAAITTGDQELMHSTLQKLLPVARRFRSGGIVELNWEGPLSVFIAALEAALGRFDDAERHYEEARVQLTAMDAAPHLAWVECELAELFVRRGKQLARARSLFESALAMAERLDMPGLRSRIRSQAAFAAPDVAFGLEREGDVWAVTYAGRVLRLKHTRGLGMLALLIERQGEEVHVTELMGPPEGVDGGDAGEAFDRKARNAYRERVEALREELREAETFSDAARASRAREEIDALAGELARAVGIGGQNRRVGSNTERARVAVRQRIRDALKKISEQAPELGKFLEKSVKTGTYCSYHPPERWPLHE